MTHFALIKFAQSRKRRWKTLSEVMPAGDQWRHFVLLADAYLSTESGDVHIRSFSDLQRAMSLEDSLQALLAARASGRLTEGRHALPDAIVGCLAQFDAESSRVRRWYFGTSEPSTIAVAVGELADVWPCSDVEEIEVVDRSANWYFRMKADEPLIFMAVRARSLLDQIRHCENNCIEVDGDFEYAV